MSKNYTQLSLAQRYQIQAFVKAGMTQKRIAEEVGVHPSTISRELARNTPKRGKDAGQYLAEKAQRRTAERQRAKPRKVRFTAAMQQQAASWLVNEKWSPELISVVGKQTGKCPVSIEWLYQWIWRAKRSNKLADRPYKRMYQYLKHGKRRRKRGNRKDSRGVIPNRIPIDRRPAIVNRRQRPGDLEADFMMGKGHKGALLVLTDRATLHTRLCKLPSRHSSTVSKIMVLELSRLGYPIHTITFDNDMGFAAHGIVAQKLGVKTYFTRPYTSQDKGTVENRIGQLRRFFPKMVDLRTISNREIKRVEQLLNNRPVRKFNYKTPNQLLQEKIALVT